MIAVLASLKSRTGVPTHSEPHDRLMLMCWMRVCVSLALVLALLTSDAFNTSSPPRQTKEIALLVALIYGLTTLSAVWAILYSSLAWRAQLYAQLLIDFALLPLLLYELGGVIGPYSMLMLIPVAAAASLLSWPSALFVSAVSVLILLGSGLWVQFVQRLSVDWLLVGLYGIAGFAITGVLRFAADIADKAHAQSQRATTQQQIADAIDDQQLSAQRNALIVLDRQGLIRHMNIEARALAQQAGVHLELGEALAQWTVLADWLRASQTDHAINIAWPPAGALRARQKNPDHAGLDTSTMDRSLLVKPQRLSGVSQGETVQYTMLTFETPTQRLYQVQQSNLAAIGRLSASMAHEIRNPLAAISQSAELLKESPELNDVDQTMLGVLIDNTQRIERIIQTLLGWAGGMKVNASAIDVLAHTQRICSELCAAHGVSLARLVIQAPSEPVPTVWFDADHLQQILDNLIHNALRFATDLNAAVCINIVPREQNLAVFVLDDGPAIAPQIKAHLFEPFKTTGKPATKNARGGNGLGLFISREYAQGNQGALRLIERNPQSKTSWVQPPYTKAFVLIMPYAAQAEKVAGTKKHARTNPSQFGFAAVSPDTQLLKI